MPNLDLKKKVKNFIKKNPNIEEALRIFKISDEQYKKSLQLLQSGTFSSDTVNISLDLNDQSPWMNQ